ncbi:conserved hypothetical protein [Thiocapsa sp. KS1]|nr:conserved hypothetical protein [Thiocapsa sp. KS1]
MGVLAENLAHHPDQPQGSPVADPVVDAVRILARGENPLVAEDRQVLGDIALGGPDMVHDLLDADLLVTQGAEDLQPQRV